MISNYIIMLRYGYLKIQKIYVFGIVHETIATVRFDDVVWC